MVADFNYCWGLAVPGSGGKVVHPEDRDVTPCPPIISLAADEVN